MKPKLRIERCAAALGMLVVGAALTNSAAPVAAHEAPSEGLYVSSSSNGVIALVSPSNRYIIERYLSRGLSAPAGITTDEAGNVYVADPGSGAVREYGPGAAKPSRTYFRGLKDPIDVATDPHGDIFAVDFHYGSNRGTVVEYQQGVSEPIRRLKIEGNPTGLVADRTGDLFVLFTYYAHTSNKSYGALEIFDKKSRVGRVTSLRIPASQGAPTVEMVMDKSRNLVFSSQFSGLIYVAPPPYDGSGLRTLRANFTPGVQGIALNAAGSTLYVSDYNQGTVTVLRYPSAKIEVVLNSSNIASPSGVAALPAPRF